MNAIVDLIGKLLDAARGLPGLQRDRKRKETLRGLLEDDPDIRWRGIETLARAVGTSEEKTRELLVSIGARASIGGGREVWGLKSRVDAPASTSD